MSKAIQKFTLSAVDPKELVTQLLEYGKKGAWLPDDEYPFLNHYPKHVKLAIEVVDGIGIVERTPNIIAFDPVYDVSSFSKEELDELSWDDFKKICKEIGVSGRDRTVMTNRYLDFVSSNDKEESTTEVVNVEQPKPKTPRRSKTKEETS